MAWSAEPRGSAKYRMGLACLGSLVANPRFGLVRRGVGRAKEWFGRGCAHRAGWSGGLCVFRPNLRRGSELLRLCRLPRMVLGWSKAGADLRPDPSYPGEDLHRHYELPSLTRWVSRIVLRVPTRRMLLGGWTLFEGITEGTKRQAEGSCRGLPGAGGVLSRCCPNPMYLGTVVYKVTQGPSRGDGPSLLSFSPLARECVFLLELESWPGNHSTIVALVPISIYTTIDAAVGVLTL